MGEKDTITKNYMQDKTIFADAFNFLMYDGKQVIKPEQLKPVDTASLVLPYGDDGKVIPFQKFRDVIKVATAMEDGNRAYLVFGIENQSNIHMAMPVKNMLYDSIQYSAQVAEIAKRNRAESKEGTVNKDLDFLSGLSKKDKLLPVITLTVYFGPDKWTAPRDLHSMLDADEETLKFIDNYHLHLIAPHEIKKKDFSKFHSELRLVMKYIKYSKDKEEFYKAVGEDEAFKSVSKTTADLINLMTGYDFSVPEDEGGNVNVCEAIKGIKEDAWNDGRNEGKDEGKIITLLEFIDDGIIDIDEAAKRAGMTVEEFKRRAAEIEKADN